MSLDWAHVNIAQTAQTVHPSDRSFFDELRVVPIAYCGDAYAKCINGNQGAVKSI